MRARRVSRRQNAEAGSSAQWRGLRRAPRVCSKGRPPGEAKRRGRAKGQLMQGRPVSASARFPYMSCLSACATKDSAAPPKKSNMTVKVGINGYVRRRPRVGMEREREREGERGRECVAATQCETFFGSLSLSLSLSLACVPVASAVLAGAMYLCSAATGGVCLRMGRERERGKDNERREREMEPEMCS